jgi:hypothetical protein
MARTSVLESALQLIRWCRWSSQPKCRCALENRARSPSTCARTALEWWQKRACCRRPGGTCCPRKTVFRPGASPQGQWIQKVGRRSVNPRRGPTRSMRLEQVSVVFGRTVDVLRADHGKRQSKHQEHEAGERVQLRRKAECRGDDG